jgi:hypothetical protein
MISTPGIDKYKPRMTDLIKKIVFLETVQEWKKIKLKTFSYPVHSVGQAEFQH